MGTTEYHKINAPFMRDKKGVMLHGEWAMEEFKYLEKNDWVWTEKVDGTNIRVFYNPDSDEPITFGGRTDNAQIPPALLTALHDTFVGPFPDVASRFRATFPDAKNGEVVLYGEGYGPRINGGGKYRDTPGFVLFDVKVGDWWLKRRDVNDVASKLAVDSVPLLGVGSLPEAFDVVAKGLKSVYGDFEAEGMVGTPMVPLFDRAGRRIVIKVKARDFK